MKRYILFIICLLLLQINVFGNFTADSLDILTPRSHNPAFVMPGGLFSIEVREAKGLTGKGWKAFIKNDMRSWPLSIKTVVRQRIHHNIENGWLLTISVAKNVPPELMELNLTHLSGKFVKSVRSVSIVPDFENDFYIFHQSDQHIAEDLAGEPGGKVSATFGNGSKQALQWLTPVFNLTNPRFVLQTGDNMQLYDDKNKWCGIEEAKLRVKRFLDGFSDYTVPTMVATGNHDIGFLDYVQINEWRKEYQHVMGQRAFSVKMGSFYVLLTEWTSKVFQPWAKTDYEASFKDPQVKYRLLASHFYEGLSGWTTIAGPEKPCDLLLCGHNHRTKTLQSNPYYALSVTTAQEHQTAAFFNFKRTNMGWETSEPAQHAEGVNVNALVGDNGIPKVGAIYTLPNNGTSNTNTALISNALPHSFYNGRVRFLLKKGNYKVVGGTILAQYNDESNRITVVLVKTNIVKNSITKVSVAVRG